MLYIASKMEHGLTIDRMPGHDLSNEMGLHLHQKETKVKLYNCKRYHTSCNKMQWFGFVVKSFMLNKKLIWKVCNSIN